jgi:hypothetical protein
MGILETIDLGPEIAAELRPYYTRCRGDSILPTEWISKTEEIKAFSLELAGAFEKASTRLAFPHGPHA